MGSHDNHWVTMTPTAPYLSPLSVILPFARKLSVLKPSQHLPHALGGVGEHRLQGDAGGQPAVLRECPQAVGQEGGDQGVVIRVFTEKERTLGVHGEI